jgi:hypothetical protein
MEALDNALDAAQTELAAAEISLVEATARAEAAREAAARLKAAVAALSGEAPPAPDNRVKEQPASETVYPVDTPSGTPRTDIHDMSPEEFDADRKKRQRARQKELDAQNPYANVKCSGCGVIGKMVDQIIQAPSGVPVRMLVCNGCGNQIMQ